MIKKAKSNAEQLESLKWNIFPTSFGGTVCLVDCMGNDAAIAQAARVSYGDGTKRSSDDETLIRYLMRHRHTSPFEMCELKFRVRVPMDCWRQWIRHRTASVNEYSTRYSVAIHACATTKPDAWRLQNPDNAQGSSGNLDLKQGELLSSEECDLQRTARAAYERRLAFGVAREQARKDLPLSTFTEAYWKVDLHNLFHFLALRMDDHAQSEIREYANLIGHAIVAELFPVAWEAFQDYVLDAMSLTTQDQAVIREIIRRRDSTDFPVTVAEFNDCCTFIHRWSLLGSVRNVRERNECLTKLRKLGIVRS